MTVLQCIRKVNAALHGRLRTGHPDTVRKICTAVVILLAFCRPASLSSANGAGGYRNTSVAGPVRSATIPLSSYQSGLVTKPNPIDRSSNRVITGNVAAGKHFRGNIPYRSTTSLDTPLGSASLDSFMRYTAMAQTPTYGAGTYSPYYSPTATAATTQPGTRSVLAPGTSRVGYAVAPPPVLPPRIASAGDVGATPGDGLSETLPPLRLWPQSQTPDLTRDGMSHRFAEPLADRRVSPPRSEALTVDEYKRQMELLQQRLGQVRAELAELDRSVTAGDETSQPTPVTPRQNLSRKEELLQETARLLATTTGQPAQTLPQDHGILSGNDVKAVPETRGDIESPLQLYDPSRRAPDPVSATAQRRLDGRSVSQTPMGAGTSPSRSLPGVSAAQRTEQTARALNASVARLERSLVDSPASQVDRVPNPPGKPASSPTGQSAASTESPVRKVDEETAAASIRAFERHLGTAEHRFNCGQYAQAAESFALASAYLPSNARAHLGRSHALLAAGEFARSALSLASAIELDPQYALKQSDLVRIVGGPDAFIARFNELDKLVQTGHTPQLQLLLAYIYHQMERPQEAKAAIATAQNALPSSTAVSSLKAVIDQ